ncbi:hypothetical protein [Limnoglobus roseus]|uniref:Uncharacterized protein n=1 Tax=Limnoglobus roseus TaxID=2598579 RepID=A0A5C1ANF5_9BACT|nr:hypothetical protein [Limnoglobus roseus]QEL20095.1 hypothetical protein PX52LOC_07183 [Limnoglobus roseus]
MIVSSTAEQPVPPTDAPPVDLPPPPAPTVEQAAEWPSWVKSIDTALLVLTLVTAFLVASNIARNNDQWLHYASGRALLNGEYSLGSDPFSFATAGRTWVNHSWLSSVAAYLLYKADTTGFVIVVLKAVLFAATFGIVLLIRRPGQAIWPWAFATALAVVAAAPNSGLRPILLSAFFLALTLYLLLGRDWKTGTRFNLIALGVLSWVWASSDSWFFLGPLSVALTLAGEAVQRLLTKADDTDAPPIRSLAIALGVSVLAASLTPHHVRVWELPAELGFHLPADYKADRDLHTFTLSPLDRQSYISREDRGNSFSGYAFAALLVGGGIVLSLAGNFGKLRVTHILLWMAFAGLALMQYRLILLFSVAAVPLLALAMSGLIERIRLGPANGPRANLLLLLSRVGRIVAFPAALILVAAAYPGKLLPAVRHPSLVARVAWGVEPDPGLKRTAEMLNEWRASGKLPDDYHGLYLNFDLANYVAWFAPREKVFANGRFAFHAPELGAMIQGRRIFFHRSLEKPEPITAVEVANFRQTCAAHDITYLAYAGLDFVFTPVSTEPLFQLSNFQARYPLWHVDGRAIVLGDPNSKAFRPGVFAALAFDPVRLAFRSDLVPPVPQPPEPIRRVPAAEKTFLDAFLLDPVRVPPLGVIDAQIWANVGRSHGEEDYVSWANSWANVAGAVGHPFVAFRAALPGLQATYHPTDVSLAYQVMALRSVWRAIADDPDYAGSYTVLAALTASGQRGIPGFPPQLREKLHTAALRQYLERLPPPEDLTPSEAGQAFSTAFQLHLAFQPAPAGDPGQPQAPQLPEPAAEVLRIARRYLDRAGEQVSQDPKENEERRKAVEDNKKAIEARLQQMYTLMQPANDRFVNRYKGQDAAAQAQGAAREGLLVQALEKFNEAVNNKNLGPHPEQLMLLAVGVNIALGKLDDAEIDLRQAEEVLGEARGKGTGVPQNVLAQLQDFRMQLWHLRGNYVKLGEAMEQSTRLPTLSPAERAAVQAAAGKASLTEFQNFLTVPALMGTVGGAGVYGQATAQMGVNNWTSSMSFFLGRSLLLILEGKIDEAKGRLDQAIRPDKIAVPAYLPERELADQYLRMIEHAQK